MNRSRMIVLCWALLAALASLVAVARAEDSKLDELHKSGVVGERYDGFAVVRSTSADAKVKALVDQVNGKRKAIYEAQAKKESAPLVEVGKVYALQIAAKAPAGTWFLGEDGKWQKK